LPVAKVSGKEGRKRKEVMEKGKGCVEFYDMP